MKCLIAVAALLSALLSAGCASTPAASQDSITFHSNANEPTRIEILAPPRCVGKVSWLRAQETATEKLRIITSFRVTLFEDIDGNERFDEADRQLDYAYGKTELPSWFIEVSGLTIPSGVKLNRLRVLAEVETTLGNKSTVFRI